MHHVVIANEDKVLCRRCIGLQAAAWVAASKMFGRHALGQEGQSPAREWIRRPMKARVLSSARPSCITPVTLSHPAMGPVCDFGADLDGSVVWQMPVAEGTRCRALCSCALLEPAVAGLNARNAAFTHGPSAC